MKKLTLTEWCTEQGLLESEIDFVTSLMTLLSTHKYGGYLYNSMIEKVSDEFSEFKFDHNRNYLSYDDFNDLIKCNFTYLDAEEFLRICCESGLCKPLALTILETK